MLTCLLKQTGHTSKKPLKKKMKQVGPREIEVVFMFIASGDNEIHTRDISTSFAGNKEL